MINVDKQVAYWRQGTQEDWAVAEELITSGHIRHGLFFAQLALEKALKGHVCRQIRDIPPRIHNLPRLAELAVLNPDPEQLDVLAEMTAFNIEGRYPDTLTRLPTAQEAQHYMARAGEVLQWLMSQL
jgi:HEPN domain-containing protein